MKLFNNKIKNFKKLKHNLIKLFNNKNENNIFKNIIKNLRFIFCSNNNLNLNILMPPQKNHEINLSNF